MMRIGTNMGRCTIRFIFLLEMENRSATLILLNAASDDKNGSMNESAKSDSFLIFPVLLQ